MDLDTFGRYHFMTFFLLVGGIYMANIIILIVRLFITFNSIIDIYGDLIAIVKLDLHNWYRKIINWYNADYNLHNKTKKGN